MTLRINKVQDEKSKIFLNKLLKFLSKQFTKMGRKNSSFFDDLFSSNLKNAKSNNMRQCNIHRFFQTSLLACSNVPHFRIKKQSVITLKMTMF